MKKIYEIPEIQIEMLKSWQKDVLTASNNDDIADDIFDDVDFEMYY